MTNRLAILPGLQVVRVRLPLRARQEVHQHASRAPSDLRGTDLKTSILAADDSVSLRSRQRASDAEVREDAPSD